MYSAEYAEHGSEIWEVKVREIGKNEKSHFNFSYLEGDFQME